MFAFLHPVTPTPRKEINVKINQQRGISLIELVVTIVITSIALLSIVNALRLSLQSSADPMIYVRTVALAESYFDEMSAQRYDENTPIGGIPACTQSSCTLAINLGLDSDENCDHISFDDIDDFDCINTEIPTDAEGNLRPGYGGFRVSVSVSYAGAITGNGFVDSDAKFIQLTINDPLGNTVEFSQYRTNF